MPTAAAAALSRVDDKSAVRRQHGIDIHLRCRELGCAAAALDENASSVAINAERLTVRGDRARQQSKGGQNMQGQNMLHALLDESKGSPQPSWHDPRRAAVRVGRLSTMH